jgi:hypothetical protein
MPKETFRNWDNFSQGAYDYRLWNIAYQQGKYLLKCQSIKYTFKAVPALQQPHLPAACKILFKLRARTTSTGKQD